MSDTERVVEIIRVMGMNNIQFSQKTGISPASLSHITSGRSNPTLTILRNIVESFPELNPEWVLLGRGDMFRNASTPENDQNTGANSSDDAAISPTGGNMSQENGLFTNEDFAPSFDFSGSNTPSETTRQGTTRQAV
ncbi:MAG: helix-turn-helix transcriptional regulator, partial [Bacteroidaceae bacterium]|nr:helix-turn-helix transcriptional regulator [Bacteroidaceae bacterium]